MSHSEHQFSLVNIYGAIGSGKSTVASGVFWKLKMLQYSVNLVTEFSRELGYDHSIAISDIPYVIGNQWHRIYQSYKFDIVINDSPLPQWTVFHSYMDKECKDFIFYLNKKHSSMNYFLKREFPICHQFNRKVDELDKKMQEYHIKLKEMLDFQNIEYKTLKSNESAVDIIVADIVAMHTN